MKTYFESQSKSLCKVISKLYTNLLDVSAQIYTFSEPFVDPIALRHRWSYMHYAGQFQTILICSNTNFTTRYKSTKSKILQLVIVWALEVDITFLPDKAQGLYTSLFV